RCSSPSERSRGSTTTPPFAPPNGMPTTAHFHVIHLANALTSSMETFGWYRIPPLDGPREVLWWTRYPLNTRTVPSSIRVGTATSSVRLGTRRTSRTFGSSCIRRAASSSWRSAVSQADWVFTFISSADGRPILTRHVPFLARSLGAPHPRGSETTHWQFIAH